MLRHVFRSATEEEIPLFAERAACLREAGQILYEVSSNPGTSATNADNIQKYQCSFTNCISTADGSAAALVNFLVNDFPCFRDHFRFEERTVRFYKRAQILVADIWACFGGEGYGAFNDIDKITMFADYRIPQMLNSLGCLMFSPSLETKIRAGRILESGENCEIELRGCSIWCVELIRREILKEHPDATVNAILIDFFLYDTIKEKETTGKLEETIPHHRSRSIWY